MQSLLKVSAPSVNTERKISKVMVLTISYSFTSLRSDSLAAFHHTHGIYGTFKLAVVRDRRNKRFEIAAVFPMFCALLLLLLLVKLSFLCGSVPQCHHQSLVFVHLPSHAQRIQYNNHTIRVGKWINKAALMYFFPESNAAQSAYVFVSRYASKCEEENTHI